jgi:hypothetical protein
MGVGSVGGFFLLAFVLAWIFWIPAALLFPAEAHTGIPVGLVALQTLGAVAPSIAAVVVLRLGLPIVAAIASAHGGRVRAEPGPQGGIRS